MIDELHDPGAMIASRHDGGAFFHGRQCVGDGDGASAQREEGVIVFRIADADAVGGGNFKFLEPQ